MSKSLRNGLIRLSLIAMLACYYVGGLVADDPASKVPSQFAPFADLIFDLQRRVSHLEQATDTSDQETTRDEAHVIAIVASQLALHDHRQAENVSSFEALSSASSADSSGTHELPMLARHLPYSCDLIRQGIYSSHFDQEHQALAGRCSTLALLANYCAKQETCCPDDSRREDWEHVCFELRDSAAEVNLACHDQSQTAAVAALARLQRSCLAWEAVASAIQERAL
jgi:hypothetical protein